MTSDTKVADPAKAPIETTDNMDAGSGKLVAVSEPTRPRPEILKDLPDEEMKALEKKLLRKVDFRLLPTMILIYIMNYLDR